MNIYEQLVNAGLTPGEASDIEYMLKGEEEYDNA